MLSLWILYVGEMAINQVKIWESVYSLQTLISMSTACYFSTFTIWTFERQLHTGNWGFQYQIRLLISSYFETWILFQASFISFRNQLWQGQTGVSTLLNFFFCIVTCWLNHSIFHFTFVGSRILLNLPNWQSSLN